MSISPILKNRIDGVHNSVNFTSKRKNDLPERYEEPKTPSYIRRVPVMVLIAMSPLTIANSEAKGPAFPTKPDIEAVEQRQQNKPSPSIVKKEKVHHGYEEMQFVKLDNNGNLQNIEKLGVNYSYLSEGGYKGLMNLVVNVISAKPDRNNRYLILYNELKSDGSSAPQRATTIAAPFGQYILKFARSNSNNYAVVLDQKGHLNQLYGGDISPIEDQVTILYDEHTGTTYKYPARR